MSGMEAVQMQREAPARTIIRMRDIIKRFYIGTPNELQILNGISLDVREGEFLSIVGESGSGKSTLMNIIGCLDTPTSGEYILHGRRVDDLEPDELARIRNREIGFIFQQFQLLPRLDALKNVELPMLYAGVDGRTRAARAAQLLEKVGMGEEYLKEKGAEILIETARVWADVGSFAECKGGKYCICDVTGPDEYNVLVDNNFYTNLMA